MARSSQPAINRVEKTWVKIAKAGLITAGILLIWRLAYNVPVPLIDRNILGAQDSLFGFLNVLSGGALSQYSIVALGVMPYITAQIIVEMLQMDVVPAFKEWADEGVEGKTKLNAVTRYLSIAIAFIQALTIAIGVSAYYNGSIFTAGVYANAFTYVYLALVMTAGTGVVLWLADLITVHGIGNGVSMFIVAGIIAEYPSMISTLVETYITGDDCNAGTVIAFFGILLFMVAIVIAIIFMEQAQRKIPVQYANRPAGASLSGQMDSSIPVKLNPASVIPVIFASTLMSLPSTIASFLDSSSTAYSILHACFTTSEPIGFALYMLLIFIFTFFYSFMQMDPEKMADNLKKQNAYIPGIRPGDETASYISRVLFKVCVIGATYLAVIAALPILMVQIFNLPSDVSVGGTGLIIVVGVAIETVQQLKAQTKEADYKGFMGK